jgi:hypothetical protein
MSVPMRKDEPEFEEDLTTADLAQGKRPAVSEDRPKPVLAGRSGEIAPQDLQSVTSDAGSISGRNTRMQHPFSRTTNWKACATGGVWFRPLSSMSRAARSKRQTVWSLQP